MLNNRIKGFILSMYNQKKISNECFVCDLEPAISCDYLVLEANRTHVQTVRYTKHSSQERVAGIVRLTLCSDCLVNGLKILINSKTKADGSPKLFQKKSFLELNTFLDKMYQGIYESVDTAKLFTMVFNHEDYRFAAKLTINLGMLGFYKSYISVDNADPAIDELFKNGIALLSDIPKVLQTPLMNRLANRIIESKYVLWTPENQNIGGQITPILDQADKNSSIVLFPMSTMLLSISESGTERMNANNFISMHFEGTKKQLPEIVNMYNNELRIR